MPRFALDLPTHLIDVPAARCSDRYYIPIRNASSFRISHSRSHNVAHSTSSMPLTPITPMTYVLLDPLGGCTRAAEPLAAGLWRCGLAVSS